MVRQFMFVFTTMLVSVSGTASAQGSPPERTVVITDGTNIRQIANDDSRIAFQASANQVWAALLEVYKELGVAPTNVDEAARVYRNNAFVFPSTLKDRPRSDYWDCGSSLNTALGGSGRLVATVESTVAATSPTESVVVTRLTGRLRSNSGTSTNAIDCSSRGAVETFIKNAITRQLAMQK